MPQIGELAPGVWLASGFGGHGLNTTAMAGNLIARAIVHGDQTWRQFTPFELVWAGGIFGRTITQVNYWASRLRTGLAERRARAADLASSARRRELTDVGRAPAEPVRQSMVEDKKRAVEAAKSDPPPSDDAAVTMQKEMPERAGTIETTVAGGQIPPAPGTGKKRRRRNGRKG
jgi:hypothetical protein